MKKYIVRLTETEREELRKVVSTGKRSAQLITRARILLNTDQGEFGPARTDAQISELLGPNPANLAAWRPVRAGFGSVTARRTAENDLS